MNTDERNTRLKYCLFYKGEETPPFTDNDDPNYYLRGYWNLEMNYVQGLGDGLNSRYERYKAGGGKAFEGIPNELLALMMRSYDKGSYEGVESNLSDFYEVVGEYLKARQIISADANAQSEVNATIGAMVRERMKRKSNLL